MRTARQQEEISIRAEGQKEAQIIRGAADGEAARIYAASYGKDPEFYDFYRAMQSYRQTFLGENNTGGTSNNKSPRAEAQKYELKSLMSISYAVSCLNKKQKRNTNT